MLQNRKVLTAVIGYIIGIIMGLYCKISIVFFYIIFYLVYLIFSKNNTKKEFKLFSIKRYFRYVKIIFTKEVIKLIIIFSIISNVIILYQENRYENLYNGLDGQTCELSGTITLIEENRCKVKISSDKYRNTYLYIYIDDTSSLEYGDKICFSGEFSEPAVNTNCKGFNYKNYLKTLKIYGTVSVKKIEIISKSDGSIFKKVLQFLEKRIDSSNLENDEKSIIKGILVGDKKDISDELTEDFSESNISYILVVSGMHISYIILISSFISSKLAGKHFSKVISSLIVLIYMCIVGFSPSIVRAGVCGIITIMANFFYRRNDTWTDIGISLFLILLYNPYLILSVSLQLSYAGTIGIIIFQRIFKKGLKKITGRIERRAIRRNDKIVASLVKSLNSKIGEYIQNAILVTISATLMVMPIMLINFNTISITSLIISIAISFVIGPIVILGLVFVILKIGIVEKILSIFLKILISMAKWGSSLPLNQIYFVTPNILQITIYYIILFAICFWINVHLEKNVFYDRIKNLVNFFKYKFNSNKQKIISEVLIIVIVLSFIKIVPKNLKIYFVDVGQGDCTLIVTPRNKSILIDGGGNEWSDYNIR